MTTPCLVGCGSGAALAAISAHCFPGAPWSAEVFERLLASPGTFCALDPAGGFVLVRGAGAEAEILSLGVHPDARNRGVGGRLLSMAASALTRAGVEALFLEVAESNVPARSLYARSGFVEVGRRPRYYEDGADALVLRLLLAQSAPDESLCPGDAGEAE